MAKLITKNNENVTAANYDNAYGSAVLFTRDTGSGVESWCLYQQDPTHISNWYVFMGCHREVSMPDGILDMLLPLHLISDSYLRDNMGSRLALDTAYACGAKSAEATMPGPVQGVLCKLRALQYDYPRHGLHPDR